ncbi:ABC transporter permease [Teredinibacter turnerae]|uniref:ABC transporter permease n=1 Tax=Teredinibacter turnerae TaxID=2426 RepID=UPI00040C2EA2|nr:ABC transporter permease [Teredinibacter turnerae]
MISAFDIKHSLNRLVADKEYSILIIITLALCLSVSLFLYAQVYSIAYKHLPFVNADKFIQVSRVDGANERVNGGISYFEYHYIKRRQAVLENFGVWEARSVTMHNERFSTIINGVGVGEEVFSLTGIEPLHGRLFTQDDVQFGAEPVAVIGFNLWQRFFSSDDRVLGTLVNIDGVATRIVGVMPKEYEFPLNQNLWIAYEPPITEAPQNAGWLTFVGKLKPGVSLEQARDEFNSLSQELQSEYPLVYGGKSLATHRYTEAYSNAMRVPTVIMSIVAFAILAMGCFSVSNLLVVRALERSKDSMIKSAFGVPLKALVIPPLLETFVLCGIAGMFGFIISKYAITYLASEINTGPFWWKTQGEPGMFLSGIVALVLIWLIAGIFPVTHAVKSPSSSAIAGGSKGGNSKSSGPLMKIFTSSQILCAFVLMVFTGLSFQALNYVLNADYGVDTDGYIVTSLKLPSGSYSEAEQRLAYYEQLSQRIEAINGVQQVAYSGGLPGYFGYSSSYQSVDKKILDSGSNPKAIEIIVSDNYLSQLGVKLFNGRMFNDSDTSATENVAIINKNMADKLWPGDTDVVGKQFQLNPEKNGPLITVVGIVPEVIYGSPIVFDPSKFSVIYRPMTQVLHGWWEMKVVIKSDLSAKRISQALRLAASKVDNSVALSEINSLDKHLAKNGKNLKDMLYNFLPAAFLALIMSALGIYGVTKRTIMQKSLEIGVMKSVGVDDARVTRRFISENIKRLAFGVVPGVVLMTLMLPAITQNLVATNSGLFWALVGWVLAAISVVVIVASYIPLVKLHRLSPQHVLNFNAQAQSLNT